MHLLETLPEETKVLIFCESGQGRTAFMGAAYWIAKGLTTSAAITRISAACSATDWATAERRHLLDDYAWSPRGAVSQLLWKKRKAYSLGIPKTNWLME